MGDKRRDGERDVMAYLKGWAPAETGAPAPFDAPSREADPASGAASAEATGAAPLDSAPPEEVAPFEAAPIEIAPTRRRRHRSDDAAGADAAARYRRRGWRVSGAIFGVLLVAVITAITRYPADPVALDPAGTVADEAAPATLRLFAGTNWFYQNGGRTEMRNLENSCSLRILTLPVGDVDADPAVAESAALAAAVALYTRDPILVTAQEDEPISGRSFTVARVDGVTLAGDDSTSAVFVLAHSTPGDTPMAVALACPPEALDADVPPLRDALQNVWIRPRSASTTE